MAYLHRITGVITAILLVSGFNPAAFAQEGQYTEDFLAQLASGKITRNDHILANDQIVRELLLTIRERAKENKRCSLKEQSKYWGYFKYASNQLSEKMGYKDGVYYPVPLYLRTQTNAWIRENRCGSDKFRLILEYAIQYALGGQEPVPYELYTDRESVFRIGHGFIDYYCGLPGRYDPACSKLIGFIVGRPTPSCWGGLNIPAAPEPPKVVLCLYGMPINEETRRNYIKRYTFWYQRVPDNLDSLRVYGVDQFSSIAPVAVQACPKDFRAANRRSGDRRGQPAYTIMSDDARFLNEWLYGKVKIPGGEWLVAESQQAKVMPEPPLSARNPQCEDTPVAQSTNISQNFEDGDYELVQAVGPAWPARAGWIEGQVVVSFTISATGAVKEPVVVSSSGSMFHRAAIRAILKYRYKPRVVDGQPVEVTGVTKTVVFKLDE